MEQPEEIAALEPNDLTALEARLAAWRPALGELAAQRDRMIYQAGYAAARAESRVHVWRFATAALVLISIGLSGVVVRERLLRMSDHQGPTFADLATQPSTGDSAPAVDQPREAHQPPASVEPFAPGSYFALTTRMFQREGEFFPLPSELETKPQSSRAAPKPVERPAFPGPLRANDIERVLDL